jgi:hypothetical protein
MKMWALDREFVDQPVRPTNSRGKTMITVFFGIEGTTFLGILPQKRKPTSVYFHEHILRELAVQTYPRDRKPSIPRYMLQFDNAPVHDKEEAEQTLQECEFLRLEYPLYYRIYFSATFSLWLSP